MKTIKLFAEACCLLTVALASWVLSGDQTKSTDKNSMTPKGFALVELFTSEGCSSCPPAEELVEKIQKESNNLPIYILSFHVDYWDRLGWKDTFSSSEYSKRQNQYAKWLNLQSIYTPQIVVNGRKQFIGSEETTLRNAIKSNLQKASSVNLTLDDLKFNKNQIDFQYHTDAVTDKTSLLLALVQKSATVDVKAGENNGRNLTHVQIVRNLQMLTLDGKNNGTININIPASLDQQNLEVIAFLQKNNNGEIIAATKIGLNTSGAIAKSTSN